MILAASFILITFAQQRVPSRVPACMAAIKAAISNQGWRSNNYVRRFLTDVATKLNPPLP
jgi:hypothetical protein